MVQGVFPARALKPAPGGLLSVADVTEHAETGVLGERDVRMGHRSVSRPSHPG